MKYILRIVIVLCLISTVLGIGIGRYFVSYALGRDSSSIQRNVVNEEAVQVNADAEAVEAAAEQIRDHTQIITQEKNEWLAEVDMRNAELRSADGLKLAAEYAFAPDGHKWVILVHGYKANCHMMEVYAQQYYENGYHVLLPDNRACGNSEGTYIGMGWLDKDDIRLWIDWIIEQDNEAEIVLHGVSMGGATVMMLSGDELPGQVKAFVEDCGYTSVWDIFSSELQARFSLPAFPIMHMTSIYSKIVVGYGFKEASALEQVAKNERPMLFIHGAMDDFVPTAMVYTLYEAAGGPKELYVAEGAGHAMSSYADPETYWNTVFSFLEG